MQNNREMEKLNWVEKIMNDRNRNLVSKKNDDFVFMTYIGSDVFAKCIMTDDFYDWEVIMIEVDLWSRPKKNRFKLRVEEKKHRI